MARGSNLFVGLLLGVALGCGTTKARETPLPPRSPVQRGPWWKKAAQKDGVASPVQISSFSVPNGELVIVMGKRGRQHRWYYHAVFRDKRGRKARVVLLGLVALRFARVKVEMSPFFGSPKLFNLKISQEQKSSRGEVQRRRLSYVLRFGVPPMALACVLPKERWTLVGRDCGVQGGDELEVRLVTAAPILTFDVILRGHRYDTCRRGRPDTKVQSRRYKIFGVGQCDRR